MQGDKKVTCDKCMGVGYKHRIGVYEVMVFDEKDRQLLAEGRLDELRSHQRSVRGVKNLQETAFQRVVDGTTDVKEVVRILNELQKQSG